VTAGDGEGDVLVGLDFGQRTRQRRNDLGELLVAEQRFVFDARIAGATRTGCGLAPAAGSARSIRTKLKVPR
jgi:hypothetical protein